MPVNKLSKEKPKSAPIPPQASAGEQEPSVAPSSFPALEQETERDRELALTDAEWKNLWDATEVIDMDRF